MAEFKMLEETNLGDGRVRIKAQVEGADASDMLEGSIKVAHTVTELCLRKGIPCAVLIERDADQVITISVREPDQGATP